MREKEQPPKPFSADSQSGHAERVLPVSHATETIDLDSLFPGVERDPTGPDVRNSIWASTFGKVIQTLPIPTMLIDGSQRVIVANQACKRISPGYEKIQGNPFSGLFPSSSVAQKISALMDSVFSARKTAVSEGALEIEKDRIWARITFRPIRISDDPYALVLIEDLSSEKKRILADQKHREELEKRVQERTAELKRINDELLLEIEERKRSEEALQESERRFRQFVEKANDIIYLTDANGILTFVNPVALRISGYSAVELVGKHWLELVHPDYRQQVESFYEAQRDGQVSAGYHEFPILNKRGGIVWLGQSSRLVMHEGKVAGIQSICRDITDLKRGEQEREVLRAQLLQAQKMEAVGTLVGGIAHDFNNMLTVIIGYAEMLLMDRDARDPAYLDLRRIMETARGGAELIQRLLTFSRKTETNPKLLNVNRQIEESKRLLVRIIPKMIDLELKLADDLAPIYADPLQLDQLVMNLAINARDAMPEGGKLIIETKTVVLNESFCRNCLGATPGPYVLIEVSDTGHGMDKQTLERIFDPFFTTKSRDSNKGTGLGLAIVHGIVQQHGGHIACESTVGKGTTFRIYFPAACADQEPTETIPESVADDTAETVLIVEDEELLRDLGERVLSRVGYSVLTAANGAEALELYRREHHNIALIILDLIMPGMDGQKCFEELMTINPKVKVLIATGGSPLPATRESVHLHARGILTKPYNMSQLVQAVRDALKGGSVG